MDSERSDSIVFVSKTDDDVIMRNGISIVYHLSS